MTDTNMDPRSWDQRYRQLEEGEIILATDEIQNDDATWRPAVCVGQPAPSPHYTSHRVYRRLRDPMGVRPTRECGMCDDTGYKDYAGFAMDHCDHQKPNTVPAGDAEAVADAIEELTTRWDKLDAGSPAAQGCANRLACLVANNRSVVLSALHAAMNPKPAEQKGVSDDLSRMSLVDLDHARLALFDAIGKIKIGNPTDDKLILENLREAGFWICRLPTDHIGEPNGMNPKPAEAVMIRAKNDDVVPLVIPEVVGEPASDPCKLPAEPATGAGDDAAFLRDLAKRMRDVPAVHIDGGDIDELLRIAATMQSQLERARKHGAVEGRKEIIARGCAHMAKAQERGDYDRPDVSDWQAARGEWHQPSICEIVSDYAEWRDAQHAEPVTKAHTLPPQERVGEPDTVAFVQEWMMSGDHEADQWHRDFADAIDRRTPPAAAVAAMREALRRISDGEVDWFHKPADEMRDIACKALAATASEGA